MMNTRRGISYWTSELSGHVSFEPGDIVTAVIVGDGIFHGVVRDVDSKVNKVLVAWGGGSVAQHDPDEIQLVVHGGDLMKKRMASRRVISSKKKIAKSTGEEAEADPQFVGDPEVHGIDTPRGGGFSIMQNLQKDLREEALEESDENPKITNIHASRSRRGMYWCAPERTYRTTKTEQDGSSAVCPKCRGEMELQAFTRSEKIYMCHECGFKVPSGKVLTERPTVETGPPAEAEVIANLKSRREIEAKRRPKKVMKKRKPQKGKDKASDKKYYKKNKQKIKKKQKKYRKTTERRS